MRRTIVLAVVSHLALASCGSAAPAPAPPVAPPASDEALAPLEQRLMAARTLRIRMRVASGGSIASHYEGTLVLGEGQRTRLDLTGDMGSRPSDLSLVCDGKTMRGGSKEQHFEFPAPPALREGLVIAFVRMGLLHDLALLSEGRPPAHIDGTVRTWITTAATVHSPGESIRGGATEHWTFSLVVQGGSKAEEDVWTDARTGLPVRRRVVVHFPEGDMQVGEEYEEVTIDAPVDDSTFTVSPSAP
jgi:outer membrane lipoprotein-sorting protein